MINGLVGLSTRGVNPHLLEQGLHAEGAGLVSQDGNDALAQISGLEKVSEEAGEGHRRRGGNGALSSSMEFCESFLGRQLGNCSDGPASRNRTAQLLATLEHVLDLR